jgi:hypothetical protein
VEGPARQLVETVAEDIAAEVNPTTVQARNSPPPPRNPQIDSLRPLVWTSHILRPPWRAQVFRAHCRVHSVTVFVQKPHVALPGVLDTLGASAPPTLPLVQGRMRCESHEKGFGFG